jgi:Pyruvate/2-oxoacid:ferredoxin oxidoreductase delta subunit/nitrate reductase assembly molybdenum cofactor insertion protein NarJ
MPSTVSAEVNATVPARPSVHAAEAVYRADLFQALAEALDAPPRWLAAPGSAWPLMASLEALAPRSPAAASAQEQLAAIAAETAAERTARYRDLFVARGRPRFWLHESLYGSGQLFGPEARAVAGYYRAAGLVIDGGELPDHASVELAFLAYLARREAEAGAEGNGWRRVAAGFVKQHAGRWLPQLGRALAASGDDVYGPIGALLADWFERPVRRRGPRRRATRVPTVTADRCTLCGFCVQRCPARALAVAEDSLVTKLTLAVDRCTGCRLCERVCDPGALQMTTCFDDDASGSPRVLVRSPRVSCRRCGAPMVSAAELAFVARQLGNPSWLTTCPACRGHMMER